MDNQYRTVNIPTKGPVNFPADFTDEQVHDAVVKNYPELYTKQRQASDSFFANQGKSPFAPMPGLTPLPSSMPNIPDASIATPEGKARREAMGNFHARMSGAASKLAGMPLNEPQTPNPIDAIMPEADRNRMVANMHLGVSPTKEERARLAYSNRAVGGTDADPSGSSFLANDPTPFWQAADKILPLSAKLSGLPGAPEHYFTQDIPNFYAPHPATPGTLETGDNTAEKIARAVGGGGWRAVQGLPTPVNAAFAAAGSLPEKLGGTVIGEASSMGFTGQQLYGAGEAGYDAAKKLARGDVAGAAGSATDAAVSGLFGGISALHAMHGVADPKFNRPLAERETNGQLKLFPDLGRKEAEAAADFKPAQEPHPDQLGFNFPETAKAEEAPAAPPASTPALTPEMGTPEHWVALAKDVNDHINAGNEDKARNGLQAMMNLQELKPTDSSGALVEKLQKRLEDRFPRATSAPATPEVTTPAQAQNPSSPATELEGPLRKTVSAIIRTRQLAAAAATRLQVELALKASGGKDEDDTLGTPSSQRPIVRDNSQAVTALPKDDLAKVQAVASALGIAPKDLEAQKYYLTHEQLDALDGMKKQGIRPFSLKGTGHPEEPFGEYAHYPLAKINTNNAKAAGIPNAKNLWDQLSTPFKKAHEAFKSRYSSTVAPGQAENSGLSTASRRQMEQSGGVTADEGKDEVQLQHEHDMLQSVLADRLKQAKKSLNDQLPAWRQARITETQPSPLATDLSKLSKGSLAGLPKELYAQEHLNPKTPTGSVEPESVSGAKAPEVSATGQSTPGTPKSEGEGGAVVGGIKALADDILKQHGQAAFDGMSRIFDEVAAKYKLPENVNKVLYSALERYQEHLTRGTENPMEAALNETVRAFPQEKPGTTLYSNPIGPLFNKVFGKRQTPVIAAPLPGPLSLVDSPLHQLTDELAQRTGPSSQERFSAFLENEKGKLQDAIGMAPSNAKLAIDKVKEWTKAAWTAFATRPGLTPLEQALGMRSLQLTGNAFLMQAFHHEILRNHPDARVREAMVNYLQAGGGVRPDADVHQELNDKADQFNAAASYENKRLQQGYRRATQLTPEEKATIAKYREYDKFLGAQESSLGLDLHARENYIRQIWSKNSLAQRGIDGLFGSSSFSVNPNFTKLRTFEDYFAGEQAGLVPKNKDFAYLTEARARASAEVLSNRLLVEQLYKGKMADGSRIAVPEGVGNSQQPIDPSSPDAKGALLVKKAIPKAAVLPDGRAYARVDHAAFQNWKWVGNVEGGLGPDGKPLPDTQVLYKGNMLIHPDLKPQIDRILNPSALRKNAIGRAALKVSSVGKQTLLVGLFHPMQLGVHFLEHAAEGSTSKRTMSALNPFAKATIDLNDKLQQHLVIHGLKLSDFNAESLWDEGVMSKGFVNGLPVMGPLMANLHDAMFQKYIPNLKMAMALDALDRNMNRYHDSYKAEELAKPPILDQKGKPIPTSPTKASWRAQSRILKMTADQMNAAFGGLNWESLPINKTAQDTLRLLVLAPDFLLARMQFAGDAFRPGGMESRKALLIGAGVQYLAARAFNAAMNDGDAKWAPEDWNKFIYGKNEYNLRTVQGDMSDSVFNTRRFVEHRLNPGLPRVIQEAWSGKDVFGHPASAGQQLYDAAKNFTPIPLQGVADWAANKLAPNLRGPKDAEGSIADPIISSLTSVQRRQYRTPAEKIIYQHFDDMHPASQDNDDLALEQKRVFNSLRDKVNAGTITPDDIQTAINTPGHNLKTSEIKYLFRTKNESQLVTRARQLPINEVLEAFNSRYALPMEKVQLAPLIQHKLNQLTPEERAPLQQQINDFRQNLSPSDNQKIRDQILKEIQWEQAKQEGH
jgi:hypothetical protein